MPVATRFLCQKDLFPCLFSTIWIVGVFFLFFPYIKEWVWIFFFFCTKFGLGGWKIIHSFPLLKVCHWMPWKPVNTEKLMFVFPFLFRHFQKPQILELLRVFLSSSSLLSLSRVFNNVFHFVPSFLSQNHLQQWLTWNVCKEQVIGPKLPLR